jgi:hypothetical protein
MFSANDIRARVHEEPFVPFRIVTSSGENYEVHHPELIMVGKRDLIVGTASAKSTPFYDKVHRIAIMHVTALSDLPTKKKQGGNGQQ